MTLQQAGILTGDRSNKFNPKAKATRAQVYMMLYRFIKLNIEPDTAQGWAINDDWHYLYYSKGKALTGWQNIDGKRFFFEADGILKTGWVKDGKNIRYYNGNNAVTGWQDISTDENTNRYYFNGSGIMVSGGWHKIDGKWYYFHEDGTLATNTVIDGYKVDENGVRKKK